MSAEETAEPTVADLIRVRVEHKPGGTYRGVLVVKAPGRTYTRRVGAARLTERDAFGDAYRARKDCIAINQLPE